MLIELSRLEDGRGGIEHIYSPTELNLADERVRLLEDTRVSAKIRRSGAEVVIDGTILTAVEVECDRCLKPVNIPVKSEFSLEYLTKSDYEASQVAELTDEEMEVSVFEGDTINLDEIVREQILLFVPARTLCVESCKGICSSCGADLNAGDCGCVNTETDPRWAALKNFRITE